VQGKREMEWQGGPHSAQRAAARQRRRDWCLAEGAGGECERLYRGGCHPCASLASGLHRAADSPSTYTHNNGGTGTAQVDGRRQRSQWRRQFCMKTACISRLLSSIHIHSVVPFPPSAPRPTVTNRLGPPLPLPPRPSHAQRSPQIPRVPPPQTCSSSICGGHRPSEAALPV
jgi:hypothetical protein